MVISAATSTDATCCEKVKSGDTEGQGIVLDVVFVVVGEKLCGVALLHGVWHCRVEVQCYTTFHGRNGKNKQTAFLFLNSIEADVSLIQHQLVFDLCAMYQRAHMCVIDIHRIYHAQTTATVT